MLEVRKRPMSPDNLGPSQKKRIITASGSSKAVSGSNKSNPDDDDEPQGHDLERFRKEAIFRRMKHYSRECERLQTKLLETQTRCDMKDSSVAAVEACWKQLVSQINLLMPNAQPSLDDSNLNLYDLASYLTTSNEEDNKMFIIYNEKLSETSRMTQSLVASFIQFAPKSTPAVEELRERCRRSQSQLQVTQSENQLLQSRLKDVQLELETCREKLLDTRNQVERARSETVVVLEAKNGKMSEGVKKEDVNGRPPDTIAVTTPIMGPTNIPNGHGHAAEDDTWKTIAERREAFIQRLQSEKREQESIIVKLREEAAAPTELTVATSTPYLTLKSECELLKAAMEANKERADKSTAEVEEYRTARLAFENKIQLETSKKIEELTNLLQKQNGELTRIRAARDAAHSENHEYKAREAVKITSMQELKTLNKAKSDLIVSLKAEVKRLKARLAADVGNEDLLKFILGASDAETKYVHDLQTRLSEFQLRVRVLDTTLAQINQASPDMAKLIRSEADARELYEKTRDRLEKYERTYGSSSSASSSLPADTRDLSALLRERDESLQKMRLKQQASESEIEAVYSEMDNTMQAWETLEKQSHAKVFDLASLEEKLAKYAHEKAKAEQKYFNLMKLKDTIESERKALTRSMEKQSKVMEKLQDGEKNLANQLHNLEKELSVSRSVVEAHKTGTMRLEEEKAVLQVQLDSEAKRSAFLRAELVERQNQADAKRTEIRLVEEENIRLRRENERPTGRSVKIPEGEGNQREQDLQSENEKLFKLLRCSTCEKEFRTHVLVKCMHTFCKGCIDARIMTRQRKCPACQMSFATSDVQTLYFQ